MCFRPLITWVSPMPPCWVASPSGRVDLDIGYTPYVVGYARFDLAAPQAFLCGFFLMAVPATTCGAPGRLSGSGLPSFSPLWGFAGSLEVSSFHFGTVSLYAGIFASSPLKRTLLLRSSASLPPALRPFYPSVLQRQTPAQAHPVSQPPALRRLVP